MKLRQSIRRAALNDANLLSSLGGAHMENEMKRAMSGMKETIKQEEAELAEKTGIETPIEQGDMEDYMKTVMEEVARARKPKST